MKRLITIRSAGIWLAGALLALGPVAANAATTAANTTVSNTATVNYQVGGVAQTPINSSASFVVDDMVVISVTHSDASYSTTNTQPGSTKAVLTFKVENDGNANQDVYLSAVNMASGTADPFGGTSNLALTTSGVYSDSGCTTAITKLTNLAPGSGNAQTVYVCSTIPAGATNGEIAVAGLLTQAGAANGTTFYKQNGSSYSDDSTSAWNSAQMQIIFAEAASTHPATGDTGAYDGYSSDLDAFKVQAANLTITKTATVLTDPVNCTTAGTASSCGGGTLHAIPGAVIQYTVTIKNAANAQDATSIEVSDDLDANVTYQAGTIAVDGSSCGDAGSPTVTVGTSTATCTYTAPVSPNPGNIDVKGFTVAGGASPATVTITYEVKIN